MDNDNYYYFLEVYPEEMYDPETIIKKEDNLFNNNDLMNLDDLNLNNDENNNIDINNNNIDLINNENNKYQISEIIKYIKENDFPLYKYCVWETLDQDMKDISGVFPKNVFILYAKHDKYIDRFKVITYQNKDMVYSTQRVKFTLSVKLPNNTYKNFYLDRSGINFDSPYNIESYLNGKRGFGTVVSAFTDVGISIGHTAADIGGYALEAAPIATAIGVALDIVKQMQTNLEDYKDNNSKAYDLYERCDTISRSLNNFIINSDSLIPSVKIEILNNKLEKARNLIKDHKESYAITKFFGSRTYKKKLDSIHRNLTFMESDFLFLLKSMEE